MNMLTNPLSRLTLLFALMVLLPALGLFAQSSLTMNVPVTRYELPAESGKVTVHLRKMIPGHTYHLYLTVSNCSTLTGKELVWENGSAQPVECFEKFVALDTEADLSWFNTSGVPVKLTVVTEGEVAAKPVVRMDSTFAITTKPNLDSLLASLFIAESGVLVSNIQPFGSDSAISAFTNGLEAIDMQKGLLLTTGWFFNAMGPNESVITGNAYGRPGDSDLKKVFPDATIIDAAGLTFDIIPSSDRIDLQFVFASEEYPENVCGIFHDAIGIFISGPSPTWPYTYNARNIAKTGENGLPVCANSVNPGMTGANGNPANCLSLDYDSMYVDNTGGQFIEHDGYTRPFQTGIDVIPYKTYTIKLVIADTGDGIGDSGFFIAAGETSPYLPQDTTFLEYLICEDDTYNYNGDEYAPGIYEVLFPTPNGMDSLVILTISSDEHVEEDLGTFFLCAEDTVVVAGIHWTIQDEGIQEIIISKSTYPYCDSIIRFDIVNLLAFLDVEVSGPLTKTDTVVSLLATGYPDGSLLTWTDTLGNAIGMDSLLLVTEPGSYCLQVTGPEGCTATFCVEVEEDLGSAIQRIETLTEVLQVWPQPATDQVQLRLDPAISFSNGEMIIYDISGRVVFQQEIRSPDTTIHVQTWPSGMYAIRLVQDEGRKVLVGKMLIQH